jgi:hypothetical protein
MEMDGRLGPASGPVKRAGAGLIRAACGQFRLAPRGAKAAFTKAKGLSFAARYIK